VLDVTDQFEILDCAGTRDELATAVAENWSDLDDAELDQYLCTEEEVKMKKQIWMLSNKCALVTCFPCKDSYAAE
jgi:hypothetical protein